MDEVSLAKRGGSPWARSTKNVKKPVSHVEKPDLRLL